MFVVNRHVIRVALDAQELSARTEHGKPVYRAREDSRIVATPLS